MLTINTNTTSLITQLNLSKSNNLVKTSIERLSTGFKINRASDDAANMSISKNMECQISGTNVALDNAQQAVNLLQTADGALDNMQANLLRIRDLTVQAMNGTYSSEEKAMIQGEIDNLLAETYKQRNSTMFNHIRIFGDVEEPGTAGFEGGSVTLASTVSLGNSAPVQKQAVGGAHPVTPLTEEEAIAQGYTIITQDNFTDIKNDTSGKYCLMGDIDFSQVTGWGAVTLQSGAEINGNGYSINNLTINSTTNSEMNGLFEKNNGTIKNLNMNNVSINKNNDYTGGLVSKNLGTIENCSVAGSINGYNNTGGLVGFSWGGTITSCSSYVTVTGNSYTGGLVGGSIGGIRITDCSSSATVSGTGDYTGGLLGSVSDGTITSCSSSATVVGNSYTGGLLGHNSNGTITSSSFSGTTTGTTRTGGLVGLNDHGTITDCSSSGTVTGTGANTGGLVGYSISGTITSSSSSGNVTGTGNLTGGLIGQNFGGIIDKSYATGNVDGSNFVGGLVGNMRGQILNSYALGNVSGNSQVGGFVGLSLGNILSSYSSGNVTGTGEDVGGFIGKNGSGVNAGNIDNSYTTSELDFYGNNAKGTISDCYGRTDQEGVTGHDADWFEDGENLSFLGEEYDTRYNPPELKSNRRGARLPVKIQLQIGANSGKENTITIDTGFSLNGLTADVSTLASGEKTLNDIDGALERMSSFRSTLGATQNRLESISQSLATRKNNMESSHSTIMDTDFALETSKLVQNQILQNVAASLLAQANTNPNIALTLLK